MAERIATAEDTAGLIEVYASILEGGVDDERVRDGYTGRVNELVTTGLGLLAEFDEEFDEVRSRIEFGADRAYAAAGLDGVPGR